MNFTRDSFEHITPPKLILCKASGERVGLVPVTALTYTNKLNDLDEITFTTYLYNDHELNPVYDNIHEMMYIEVPEYGRFVVYSIDTRSEGTERESKEVVCKSYEWMLSTRYLVNFVINMGTTESIDGVVFYSMDGQTPSLLSLCINELFPEWNIGEIHNSLTTMRRSFEVTRTSVYDFLMGEVAEAFECVFVFNTFNKTISAYPKETYQQDTNIHVSYNNLLQNTDLSFDVGEIKTALKLSGDTDVTVREINRGYDTIYNFDYYNSTEYFSEDLHEAYTDWKTLTYETPVNWNTVQNLRDPSGDLYFKFDNTKDDDNEYVLQLADLQSKYYSFIEDNNLVDNYNNLYTYLLLRYQNYYSWLHQWSSSMIPAGNNRRYFGYGSYPIGYPVAEDIDPSSENVFSIEKYTKVREFTSSPSNGYISVIGDNRTIVTEALDEETLYLPRYTYTEYNETSTYPVGAQVMYGGVLYRCIIAVTVAGIFDPTHWTVIAQPDWGMYRWYKNELNQYIWLNTNIWNKTSVTALNEKLKSAEQNKIAAAKKDYGSIDKLNLSDDEVKADEKNRIYKNYVNYYLPFVYAVNGLMRYIGTVDDTTTPPTRTGAKGKVQTYTDHQNRLGRAKLGIAELTSIQNNLNTNELKELSTFIREEELNSSNYVVTDIMTDDERFEMLNALLTFGEKELLRVSQPILSFSASLVNLFTMPEFDKFVGIFAPGNYIHISLRDDYELKACLQEITINFFDMSDFSVTFANVFKKSKDFYTDVQEALNEAHSIATSVSFNASYWSQQAANADTISQQLADGLLEAGNFLSSGIHSEFLVDERGLYITTVSDDPNDPNYAYAKTSDIDVSYDSIYIGGGRILFTDDGWTTVKMSVGRGTVNIPTFNSSTGKLSYNPTSKFGVFSDFVIAGYVAGSTICGGQIYSSGYTTSTTSTTVGNKGTHIDLENGGFEFNSSNGKKRLVLANDTLKMYGAIYATEGRIACDDGVENGFVILKEGSISKIYNNKSNINTHANGIYLGTNGIGLGLTVDYSSLTGIPNDLHSKFEVDNTGQAYLQNAYILGKVAIGEGSRIAGFYVGSSALYTTGSGNKSSRSADVDGVYLGTDGIGLGSASNGHSKFEVDSSGNMYAASGTFAGSLSGATGTFAGTLSAASGTFAGSLVANLATIGLWKVTSNGLSYGNKALVMPTEIACGDHGGTLIHMVGKNSGDSTGYLTVEVNETTDYLHVKYNSIEKKDQTTVTYVTWSTGSDERLKKDIETLTEEEASTIINEMQPLSFRYIEGNNIRHYGFTAQRINAKCEELHLDNPYVRYGEMRDDLMNVSYTEFIGPIIKVLQKQQREIESLKEQIKGEKGCN